MGAAAEQHEEAASAKQANQKFITRGNHHSSSCSQQAIKILKEWLFAEEHVLNSYPTEAEKGGSMSETGLNKKQLCHWFTNARNGRLR
jgi:hypothetical protein